MTQNADENREKKKKEPKYMEGKRHRKTNMEMRTEKVERQEIMQ
jgi:hypothetical protein